MRFEDAIPEHDVYEQTKVPYNYVFESHLLDVNEKSYMASVVLPADTKILNVLFNEDVKGLFAYTNRISHENIDSGINKLKFNFLFIGVDWQVEGDIIDRSDYVTTIKIPSECGIGFGSTFHIYTNYETLAEDNEITQKIALEEKEKQEEEVAA